MDDNYELDDEMRRVGKDDAFVAPIVEAVSDRDDVEYDDGEGDLCPDYVDCDD